MNAPTHPTPEERTQRELVGDIWRRQIADEVLSQITHDLRLINRAWADVDVDVRTDHIRRWRTKIIEELKSYG